MFRFNCRELNLYKDNSVSVQDLFESHFPNTFYHICFEDLIKTAERTLIILDGLDEFRDPDRLLEKHRIQASKKAPTATVIQTLLNGCFPNCKRIVAGRPESVNKLYLEWCWDIDMKCADIIGFSDKMIHKYIFQFSSNAEVVKQKVEEFHHLKAMAHIPVYLWIICSIFEEDMTLPAPKTMTELYIWTFAVFIREHCNNLQFSRKPISLVSLLREHKFKELWIAASHLSYKMIIDRKVIFTKGNIEQLGYSGSIFLKESAGFVVEAMRNAVEEPIYQFRHLVLQEFLCAVYCFANDVTLSNQLFPIESCHIIAPIISGLQGAMVENSQSPMVIKCFVEQLCGKKERSLLMTEELVKLMEKDFLFNDHFHCFILSVFEFQNVMTKGLKAMLTKKLSKMRNLDVKIQHCHSLDYFIHFILNLHPTRTDKTNLFNRDWLWSLAISNFEIKERQLVFLSKTISELSVLQIRNAKIEGMQGLAKLAKAVVKTKGKAEQKGKCIDLQKLSLEYCQITSEQLTALSPALPFIKEVCLSCNQQMGTHGYAEVAKAILKANGEAEQKGKCIDLQKLSLEYCQITLEELTALSPALPFIKEVYLSRNQQMEMHGYAEVAKAILEANGEAAPKRKCIDLQKLGLTGCQITSEELTALSPALPFIREVELSRNSQIGIHGYTEVGKAIVKANGEAEQKGKCINLQTLSLMFCQITSEELTALSPALPFIKEVKLSGNEQMGMHGYTEVAKAIVKANGEAAPKGKCIDLQKLSLRDCQITSEELTSLSPALPFIKEVDLSGNKEMGMHGYTEVAKAIVKANGEAAQKGKCIDLQKLSLISCRMTAEELAALSPSLPFIKKVELFHNRQMGIHGYTEVAKAIVKANGEAAQKGKCIDLETLCLCSCQITADEVTALSPALPFIKDIDLSSNKQMGTHGYTEVAKAVIKANGEAAQKGKHIDLQKLNLVFCRMTSDELTALSPALPFIKEVYLSDNEQMGTHGYTEVTKAIIKANGEAAQKGKRIDLQKLDLMFCRMTSDELTALSPALPFIKEVDLSINLQMGMHGYTEVAKAVMKANGEAEQRGKCIDLQQLSLRACRMTAEKLAALSPSLPFIKEVELSDNTQMGILGFTEVAKAIVKANGEAAQKGKCINLQKLSLKDC